MEEYLKTISTNVEGKKLIILIHSALNSSQTNNNIIFDYINELKTNNIDPREYILKMKPFTHDGTIQRITNFKSYLTYNARPWKGQTPESILSFQKKTEEEVSDLFDELEILLDSDVSSYDGLFIWITPEEVTENLSYKLGLDFPNEHIINISFPEQNYTLHYPTFIEAGNYSWFYANQNPAETWGKTINILNVENGCMENDLIGLREALSIPLKICTETEASYLGKVNNDDSFFQNKLSIFNNQVDSSFFNESMIDTIIKTYERCA